MKTSFLKSAVALVTCGLVAFGAAQVRADQQKLPSGTPYDQIGQKIEDYYKEHEKTVLVWRRPSLTRTDRPFTKTTLAIWTRKISKRWMTTRSSSGRVNDQNHRLGQCHAALGKMADLV